MFDFQANPRLKDKKAIEQAIVSCHKASATQRIRMHLILVGAVEHATGEGNGDTTLISRFYNGLGNETNKAKGIAAWLKEFTNLKYSHAKDGTEQWLKPKGEALVVRVGYDATPFYEMPKVDADNKPFDFDLLMDNLIKRAAKQFEAKQVKGEQAEHFVTIADTWNKIKAVKKGNPAAMAEAA